VRLHLPLSVVFWKNMAQNRAGHAGTFMAHRPGKEDPKDSPAVFTGSLKAEDPRGLLQGPCWPGA
jgi:hypothetical protein